MAGEFLYYFEGKLLAEILNCFDLIIRQVVPVDTRDDDRVPGKPAGYHTEDPYD